MALLRNTSIHDQLGETGDLDYPMLERAVAAGVIEDDRLDWKRSTYRGPKAREEFAKDAAAFANARGGVIVIGVEESPGRAAAAALHPFEAASEALENQMRAWARTAIQPPLPAIDFCRILNPDGLGVLAVSIPPSDQMPHMVGTEGSSGYPLRTGKQTVWLREFDIESAYRQRFDRRSSDEDALARLIDHTTDHLNMSHGSWLVAAARPMHLRSSLLPRLAREEVVRTLRHTLEIRAEFAANTTAAATPVRNLDNAALNPRPSLRSWIATVRNTNSPSERASQTYVALHDDGSLVLAAQSGQWIEQIAERRPVLEADITGLAIDLPALVNAAAEQFNIEGEYLARIDLVREGDSPFAFIAPERIGGMTFGQGQPTWSIDVQRFVPVDVVIPTALQRLDLREVAEMIGLHVASEFAVAQLHFGWPTAT